MTPPVRFPGDASRAISPVVGVLFLIGITVALAALLGTGVVSLSSDRPADVPTGKMSITVHDGDDGTLADPGNGGDCTGGTYDDDDRVTLTYQVGDHVDRDDLVVIVGSTRATEAPCSAGGRNTGLDEITTTPAELSAGSRLAVADGKGANPIRPGATVRLAWEPPDGGETYTIAKETLP